MCEKESEVRRKEWGEREKVKRKVGVERERSRGVMEVRRWEGGREGNRA